MRKCGPRKSLIKGKSRNVTHLCNKFSLVNMKISAACVRERLGVSMLLEEYQLETKSSIDMRLYSQICQED